MTLKDSVGYSVRDSVRDSVRSSVSDSVYDAYYYHVRIDVYANFVFVDIHAPVCTQATSVIKSYETL